MFRLQLLLLFLVFASSWCVNFVFNCINTLNPKPLLFSLQSKKKKKQSYAFSNMSILHGMSFVKECECQHKMSYLNSYSFQSLKLSATDIMVLSLSWAVDIDSPKWTRTFKTVITFVDIGSFWGTSIQFTSWSPTTLRSTWILSSNKNVGLSYVFLTLKLQFF